VEECLYDRQGQSRREGILGRAESPAEGFCGDGDSGRTADQGGGAPRSEGASGVHRCGPRLDRREAVVHSWGHPGTPVTGLQRLWRDG